MGCEFRPVIRDHHPESQPIGKLAQRLTDVAGADDQNRCSRFERLHKDLHLAATHADIATRQILKLVSE
jgi:hypothetical protein